MRENLEPSIIAATEGTYPPFLNSGTLNATFNISSFLANFKDPYLELNYTLITSPGPYEPPKSVPVELDPFLNFPVENQE